MAPKRKLQSLCLLFGVYCCVAAVFVDGLTGPNHKKVVVCYVSSWAVYRPNQGSFALEDIDPNLCTHLVYAFAGLNVTSNTIRPLDPWQDLKDDYGKAGYERITALKARYPHLKVTLAIGGWNEGSTNYSKMAANASYRQAFIASVVQFLRRFGFDGLDLDWEYPAKRGGDPRDKQNFVLLVKELKEEFRRHNYILTSAIGASSETIDAAYDVVQLSRYLDFLHLMCYDYHGTWDGVVGANAPLYGYSDRDTLNVENTIKHMLKLGAPADKLVMGIPAYGRTFIKESSLGEVELGVTRAKTQGFSGTFTKEAGFMGYNEICLELANSSAGWITHWHEASKTPYAVSGDKVICYDNERSIAEKVRLAMRHNLAGVMVWSIDTDDFRGSSPQSPDTYADFYNNLNVLKKNKYFKEILPELEASRALSTVHNASDLSHSGYRIQNGDVALTIAPRAAGNFALMRTIDESIPLSVQENMLSIALEKRIREKEAENEIPHDKRGPGKGGADRIAAIGAAILPLAVAVLFF